MKLSAPHALLAPLALFSLAAPSTAQNVLRATQLKLGNTDMIQHVGDVDLDGAMDAIVRRQGVWRVVFDIGGTPIDGPTIPAMMDSHWSALGDVTGDGILDFAMGYVLPPTIPGGLNQSGVQYMQGNGDGSFAAPVQLPGPANTIQVLMADVDGDGTRDIVTHGNQEHGSGPLIASVKVWFMNGPTPVSTLPTILPHTVFTAAAVDLNGDGREELALIRAFSEFFAPDVVIVEWDAAGVGTINQSVQFTPFLNFLESIHAGDVDGDGDEDLVALVRNGSQSSGYILQNTGGVLTPGLMQPNLGSGSGGTLASLPLADWDGDGDDDLLYLDKGSLGSASNTLNLVRSSGTQLELAGTIPFPYEIDVIHLGGIADLNGDGHLDVASGSAVFFGQGLLEGVPGEYVGFGSGLISFRDVIAEDFDGDGDLDLWGGEFFTWVNDGTGHGETVQLLNFPVTPGFSFQHILSRGDFNGDGYSDFLVDLYLTDPKQPFGSSTLLGTRLVQGQPDGVYIDGGSARAGESFGPTILSAKSASDFDGDGDLDVAIANGWYPNLGNGTFGPLVSAYTGVPRVIFDADNDGDSDLLFSPTETTSLLWELRLNDGSGQFSLAATFNQADTSLSAPLIVDFDQDGHSDICFLVTPATAFATGGIKCAFNLGGGSFAAPQFVMIAEEGYNRADVGDVNGDGATDLVAWAEDPNPNGVQIDVWLGSTSTPGTYTRDSYVCDAPRLLADLDGDGDDDLVGLGLIESIAFNGPQAGSIRQYGFGFAGNLVPPLLGAQGPLTPGSPAAELRLLRGVGGAPYFIFVGASEVELLNQPIPGAGIFIAPIALIFSGTLSGTPGAIGEGQATIDLTPWTLTVPGMVVPHQALVLDPAYPSGLGLSGGLTIQYGF